MQTLTELTREQAEQRRRAAMYERLSGRRETLRDQIARLESTVIAGIAEARQIAELAVAIPDGLAVSGSRFMVGGMDARYMLRNVAADVVAQLEAKDANRLTELTRARTDLEQIEKALAEYE